MPPPPQKPIFCPVWLGVLVVNYSDRLAGHLHTLQLFKYREYGPMVYIELQVIVNFLALHMYAHFSICH
jgi:hypothetical protein